MSGYGFCKNCGGKFSRSDLVHRHCPSCREPRPTPEPVPLQTARDCDHAREMIAAGIPHQLKVETRESIEDAASWLAGMTYALVPYEQLVELCGQGREDGKPTVNLTRLKLVARMALEAAQFNLIGDVIGMLSKVRLPPRKQA